MDWAHDIYAKPESSGKKFIWNGIYLLALIAILAVEPFYKQPLLDWSEKEMLNIQENETAFGRDFFVWVSRIGLGGPYGLSVIGFLCFDSLRGRSYYHLLFLCTCIFVMSVTKMAYGEPRMFWYVEDLLPDECTTEFGNPSGHTELAIAYPLMLYLDIFENRDRQRVLSQRTTIPQIIALVCAFLYSFLVGYARLYVRVHSWNQIVLGWQLGVWLALWFHFCIRDSLISHVNRVCVDQEKIRPGLFRRYIVMASLVFLGAVIALVGTYIAAKELNPGKNKWARMIQRKCPGKVIGENKFFYDESIGLSSVSILPYTAYLAILYSRSKVGLVWPGMFKTGFCASLCRILTQILVVAPFTLPLFLTPMSVPMPLQIAFTNFLPMLIAGFLLYFLPAYLWRKWALLDFETRPMHLLMIDNETSAGYDQAVNTHEKSRDY